MFLRCLLALILICVVTADESDDFTSHWLWKLNEKADEEEKAGDDDDDDDGDSDVDFDPTGGEDPGYEVCSTSKGERGRCVVYYKCDPDSVTFGYKSAIKCQSYLDVCCDDAKVLDEKDLSFPDQAVLFPLKH